MGVALRAASRVRQWQARRRAAAGRRRASRGGGGRGSARRKGETFVGFLTAMASSSLPAAVAGRSGASTAQANLRRILAVISAAPPRLRSELAVGEGPFKFGHEEGGELARVDLRLRLGGEERDEGLRSSACSVAGDESANKGTRVASSEIVSGNSSGGRSSKGKCDGHGVGEDRAWGGEDKEAEEARPYLEITVVPQNAPPEEEEEDGGDGSPDDQRRRRRRGLVGEASEKKKMEGDKGRRGVDEGYLGLLLEAVRQVSGELFEIEEEEEEEDEGGEEKSEKEKMAEEGKGKEEANCPLLSAAAAAVALEPVVRSKRGRIQALPSKYRDSVLEPWWRQSAGGGGGGPQGLRRRQARAAR